MHTVSSCRFMQCSRICRHLQSLVIDSLPWVCNRIRRIDRPKLPLRVRQMALRDNSDRNAERIFDEHYCKFVSNFHTTRVFCEWSKLIYSNSLPYQSASTCYLQSGQYQPALHRVMENVQGTRPFWWFEAPRKVGFGRGPTRESGEASSLPWCDGISGETLALHVQVFFVSQISTNAFLFST